MQNLIKNLIHAYETKNQAQFEELVEDSLTLQLEDFISFNDYLEDAYPFISEAYDQVIREKALYDNI